MRLLPALLLLALAGCQLVGRDPQVLATARVAPDFETYAIRRVGLLPVQGEVRDEALAADVQASVLAEISRSTPYEVVKLEGADLEEVRPSEPHRRGRYHAETVIALARRYRLDGILVGTLVQEQFFPPQRLSMQLELVAAETGLVIWSSSVHLDAGDPEVQESLRRFYSAGDEETTQRWELALLSPKRFVRFAAWQVASLL